MTHSCYSTSARVRDTAERAGGGVAKTWHEKRGNTGLIIHTFCSKKSTTKGERDIGEKTEGDKDKEGGRDWPKWEGFLFSAVVHLGSCATLGPWVWGNSSISYQKTTKINQEDIHEFYMKTSPLVSFCFLNALLLFPVLNSLSTFPRV